MVSVVQRIKEIKQPTGGYIRPGEFKITQLNDSVQLNPNEGIRADIIGMAVDYLTRFMNGSDLKDAFSISIRGACSIKQLENAMELIGRIKGLDDESIISACTLVGYDDCYRKGSTSPEPIGKIDPTDGTISNIRTMVKRGVSFFDKYGPVVLDGFTFKGGYTEKVNSGDGDFITRETVWDFKVLKRDPTENHTLQILMYYLMGLRSEHASKFERLDNLGFLIPA